MNFSSKIILIASIILGNVCAQANAMNLMAVYYASCERELGVVVEVDDEKLTLLNLQGDFIQLSRFDILYLAYYPVGKLPILEIHPNDKAIPTRIWTPYGFTTAELVTGWPIDFSEDQISFLTLQGKEQVIDKNAIWDLEKIKPSSIPPQNGQPPPQINLIHPYPFAYCAAEGEGQAIAPQQILGDPFLIKKELDRLQDNFSEIVSYHQDKHFYAVPQLYSNRNSLGLWMAANTRYGGSDSRSNSFSPVFVSELSEGPFSFQRLLVTGAGRMSYGLHDEPQNQFYYHMKADYIHFSVMYDLDRLLLGEERYKWQKGDLESYDDRLNELQHIAGGFDYGSWAIEYGWAPIQYAVQAGEVFFRNRVDLNRVLLRYQSQNFKGEFYYGHLVDGKSSKITISDKDSPEQIAEKERLIKEQGEVPNYLGKLRFYRINLYLWPNHFLSPEINLMYRKLEFKREPDLRDAEHEEPEIIYQGINSIASLGLDWEFTEDLRLKGFFSLEESQKEWGESLLTGGETKRYVKGGARITLSF